LQSPRKFIHLVFFLSRPFFLLYLTDYFFRSISHYRDYYCDLTCMTGRHYLLKLELH
jgi:hypothetical protein